MTYDIGRREKVQDTRRVSKGIVLRDRDVEDAVGAVVRLLERHVADHLAEHGLQARNVEQHAGAQEALELAHQRALLRVLERIEAQRAALPHARQLVVRVRGHDAGHERADAGARDDARQQVLLPQRLDDAKVIHAEAGAAAQQQRRASERLPRLVDEVVLVPEVEARHLGVGDEAQQLAHLVGVLVHQLLGANVRAPIQPLVGDAAQVAQQPRAQREHDRHVVALLLQLLQLPQARIDQAIVVVVRLGASLPGVALELVEQRRLLGPHRIRLGRRHLLLDLADACRL